MDYNQLQNKLDLSFSEGLDPNSRVWVYHSDRVFTPQESQEIDSHISTFCNQWVSHNRQLKAAGKVIFDRIILLMVDESMAGASGCSIDSSVAFVKNVELKYNANLFDRMLVTYLDGGVLGTTSLHELKQIAADRTGEVYIFDNLVKTKRDLIEKGVVPIKGSWTERFI
jgi:hypothetical protein